MRYLLLICLIIGHFKGYAQIYSDISGRVDFISDAPLEVIKASSDELQGVLDVSKKTFAFRMYIKSFQGFNSPLQREHFNENYMEVADFPLATFKGKILEDFSLGDSKLRAKGMLEIHGRSIERIIDISLKLTDSEAYYYSTFSVPLDDHDIHLPRIVYQKIAEEILVTVEGTLILR